MRKNLKFEKGSGNVFEDLELPNAKERLFKAEVAESIHDILKERGLDQKSAAKILGIDQPKISALANGRLAGFTIDRLFRFLLALDLSIDVKVSKKEAKAELTYALTSSLQDQSVERKNPNKNKLNKESFC